MSTREILRQIARENGVSVRQVKADIKEAMRAGMSCKTPQAQAFWGDLSPDGKEPSIDAFLKFCTKTMI